MNLKTIWRVLITRTHWKSRLGRLGSHCTIYKPILIGNPSRIFIGNRCQIRDFARLEVINRPELGWDSKLTIGDNVNIEQNVHIICQCQVTIEDDVSITPSVAIVDTYHPHDPPDIGEKIGNRLPSTPTFVHIGRGTFIGTQSVILPNTRIGKGCVIGAGSIVKGDVPDYSIAAGNPARILSQFNLETRTWTKLSSSIPINRRGNS